MLDFHREILLTDNYRTWKVQKHVTAIFSGARVAFQGPVIIRE